MRTCSSRTGHPAFVHLNFERTTISTDLQCCGGPRIHFLFIPRLQLDPFQRRAAQPKKNRPTPFRRASPFPPLEDSFTRGSGYRCTDHCAGAPVHMSQHDRRVSQHACQLTFPTLCKCKRLERRKKGKKGRKIKRTKRKPPLCFLLGS